MEIILILILGAILRLVNLGQSLWLDEAAQVLESQNSIGWLWRWMSADFHPPLYHFLIHFWLKLGQSEWFLRLLPVFFGVLTIYFLYLLARKLVDQKFALLTALLLSISPFHIYFSQELRMYSLSALLSVASMYFFFRALKEKKFKFWAGYTVITILNFYTLYFSFFLFAAQVAYFFFKFSSFGQVKKQFFASGTISLASFLLWLPQFWTQLEGGRWLTKALPGWQEAASAPPVKAPFLVLVKFFLGQIDFQNSLVYGLVAIFLFLFFTLLLLAAFRGNQKEAFWFFSFWFFVSLVLAVLISLKVPVISPKRLILTLPAFVSLLSLGTLSIKNRSSQILALVILILISSASLGAYWFNPKFQREDWRGATRYVETNGDPNSLALFEFSDPFAPYLWYQTGKIKSSRAFDGISAKEELVEAKLPQTTFGVNKIFLFQYLTGLTDPSRMVTKWLESHGWRLTHTQDFPGVGFIYIYEKSL